MSKLKYNTSKIIDFHVVLKIFRIRRLTHTNFYFNKKMFKMLKVKSNTFKTNQLSYFLKMSKLMCNTKKKLDFHVVLKILYNRRLTHTNFYFFQIVFKMKKGKSNTYKTIELSYFLRNDKIEV